LGFGIWGFEFRVLGAPAGSAAGARGE